MTIGVDLNIAVRRYTPTLLDKMVDNPAFITGDYIF